MRKDGDKLRRDEDKLRAAARHPIKPEHLDLGRPMSGKEAAAVIGIQEATLYRWMKGKCFPRGAQFGRKTRHSIPAIKVYRFRHLYHHERSKTNDLAAIHRQVEREYAQAEQLRRDSEPLVPLSRAFQLAMWLGGVLGAPRSGYKPDLVRREGGKISVTNIRLGQIRENLRGKSSDGAKIAEVLSQNWGNFCFVTFGRRKD